LRRLLAADAGKCDETRRGQSGFLNRHVRMLFEEAQQPAGCHARMPAPILLRDQDRQLERVREVERR
jgi:hypothetical protein